MMDFGLLPPEVTSARMYSGPGSGSMMAAAAAWSALAAQLESAARGYSGVVASLLGEGWSGPASAAMADAVAPYAQWAATTGTQAEQTAIRARAAAAAYETAFAAIVPPAVVTANRAQLANLVATNIFGQNTARIAATEAAYAQMWAQDAHAMYGYAASSSTATELTPFAGSPQTTNPAGPAAQAAAVAHATGTSANTQLSQAMSLVPQQLNALSTTTPSDPSGLTSAVTATDQFNTLTGPTGLAEATSRTATSGGSFGAGIYRAILQSQGAVTKAVPELAPATTRAAVVDTAAMPNAVLASAGRAESIAGLSVPPQWAAAAPEPTAFADSPWLSETELAEASSWEAAPAAGMSAPMAGMGPLAGAGAGGMFGAGRPTVSNVLRVGPRRFDMPRPAFGG